MSAAGAFPAARPSVGQPVLSTARLRLVPLADEHLVHEIALDADPEVMRFLGHGRGRTAAEVEALHVSRRASADRVPGLGFWVGFADDEFVGWWILEPPTRTDQGPVDGQAELGYRLVRRHWRQGLASEGARELLRYAFEDMRLSRVFAETMAVNVASRATMAAVGMSYVRSFHLAFDEPLPGSDQGEVEYAITAAGWPAARE